MNSMSKYTCNSCVPCPPALVRWGVLGFLSHCMCVLGFAVDPLRFLAFLYYCFGFLCSLVGGSLRAWRLRIPTRLVSLWLSLLCVSPPKQCVRRLPMHKGHVGACGCNIKMFRTELNTLHVPKPKELLCSRPSQSTHPTI